MRKSFLLGFIAYFLPTFPIGYIWHLVSFADAYHKLEMYRTEVIIPLGMLSMLIQGLFFSWAYPRLFATDRARWATSALKSFFVFGIISWSFTTLPVAAKYRMTSVSDFVWLESFFTIFQFAVVSPLIALAHREKQ